MVNKNNMSFLHKRYSPMRNEVGRKRHQLIGFPLNYSGREVLSNLLVPHPARGLKNPASAYIYRFLMTFECNETHSERALFGSSVKFSRNRIP